MPYALKSTGLATRLLMCVAVDDDGETIREFVSPTVNGTMTTTSVTKGTGSWKGTARRYFTTSGNYIGPKFVTNLPAVDDDAGWTSFTAIHSIDATNENANRTLIERSGGNYLVRLTASELIADFAGGFSGTTPVPNVTKASIGISHELNGPRAAYFGLESGSAALDGTGTDSGSGGGSISVTGIGGASGYAGCPGDWYIVALFSGELTEAEYQSLHNDWFGVLFQSGDTTAPVITGPSGSAGASTSAKSVVENTTAVHTFTADESVTWSKNGGADAALFTINSSTGALAFASAPNFDIAGDADGNNTYIVVVRATDTATPTPNTADQTVTVTVTNANEAPTFTGTISVPTLTEGVAMSSYATAGFFGDPDAGDTAAYSAIGTWPAGVTVNSSTGAISGTPTTDGTYASLQVRRTDGGALTIDSNSFTITVDAAPLSVTTDVVRDETNTILASTTIPKVYATRLSDDVQVKVWTNPVTNGSGQLVLSDAALTATPHVFTTVTPAGPDAGAKVYTPA